MDSLVRTAVRALEAGDSLVFGLSLEWLISVIPI
jgi:hypothetical protein